MAVTYGFYDSLNHDRLYNAQQMSAIFDGIINDGVFMSVGNQFHTVAGTGMQVIVKSGRAWFDSTWTLNDAEYPLSIDAADVLLTRIDAVVLEVNSEVATRANTIKVVKGTPASTPAKPTLTNTAAVHQHALAYVTVAKNTTAITNSMIEIVVGKTETPYVTAILQTTDITDLFNQWEDYFQTWFDTVRGTLDGDVALNLQNQITSLRRETLKNTTPPIIGLPASATPDDMFQALAKTGDLHVWRKTVVTKEPIPEVPGSYTLGTEKRLYVATRTFANDNYESYVEGVLASNAITIDLDGKVTLTDPAKVTLYIYNRRDGVTSQTGREAISGYSYFLIPSMSASFIGCNIRMPQDTIYYIPTTSNYYRTSSSSGGQSSFDAAQLVTGVPGTPAIPAGTTTTYPVSTNPNAYQEGSDAKPAGYTLGKVKIGKHILSYQHSDLNEIHWEYSSKITVSEDGTVSLVSPSSEDIDGGDYTSVAEKLIGKFARPTEDNSGFTTNVIVFFPSDATVKRDTTYGYNAMTISKYQPVTGYAAIPAGTTIEYLGKLGDKARVQVVSYVGTGTYGSSNPNSVTANFPIKLLAVLAKTLKNSNGNFSTRIDYNNQYKEDPFMVGAILTTNYTLGSGCGYKEDIYNTAYGKKSEDGKTFSWYTTGSNSARQFNESGYTYIVLLIG